MSSRSSDWFTRARHFFYGTATALVELLEDPQKRAESFGRLPGDWAALAAELEQKGEQIEQEAVRYLKSLRHEATKAPGPAVESQTPAPQSGSPTATISKEEMGELMELIHQIESLRLELERLRTEPCSDAGLSA